MEEAQTPVSRFSPQLERMKSLFVRIPMWGKVGGVLAVLLLFSLTFYTLASHSVSKNKMMNILPPTITPSVTKTDETALPTTVSVTQTNQQTPSSSPTSTQSPSSVKVTSSPPSGSSSANPTNSQTAITATTAQTQSGTPRIDSISPASGNYNDTIVIKGAGFGTKNGGTVPGEVDWYYNGQPVPYSLTNDWTDTEIHVTAPTAGSNLDYQLEVKRYPNLLSNRVSFHSIQGQPAIDSISPKNAHPGENVSINGSKFGTNPGVVIFNGVTAQGSSWSDTQISVSIPSSLQNGTEYPVQVKIGNSSSSVTYYTTGN